MCATTGSREQKKPNPNRSAAASEVWRKRRRAGIVPRFGGLMVEGIAEDGSKAMTRDLGRLGVYKKYSGVVSIHFRRKEKGPKTVVVTDIYHAVRMSKHIEKGYIGELDKNDKILKSIAVENLKLAYGKKGRTDIEEAIRNIKKVLKSIRGIRVPKKVFSREQAKAAISYLEDAVKEQDKIDGRKVGMACAKLVSFRKRYGEWRDNEVLAIKEYSRIRGCALRKLRDEWILFNIGNWVRYLGEEKRGFQMKALWVRDLKFSDNLEKLVESKKKIKLEKVEEISEELFNAGYNIKRMHRAQVVLIVGNRKEAKKIMREYMLLLRVKNPLYAAREMEKETDGYYHKATEYLEEAAKLINKNLYDRAIYCLKKAGEEIKKRKLKPQTSLGFPSAFQE